MTVPIRLTSIVKHVKLYGQHRAIRIRGKFTLEVNGKTFEDLMVDTGHVSTGGTPVRLVSFKCSLENWEVDTELQLALASEILFKGNGDFSIPFTLSRFEMDIECAFTRRDDITGPWCVATGNRFQSVEICYPSYVEERQRVTLMGNSETLKRIAELIAVQGSCELTQIEPDVEVKPFWKFW